MYEKISTGLVVWDKLNIRKMGSFSSLFNMKKYNYISTGHTLEVTVRVKPPLFICGKLTTHFYDFEAFQRLIKCYIIIYIVIAQ